jgi:hypothetical protein
LSEPERGILVLPRNKKHVNRLRWIASAEIVRFLRRHEPQLRLGSFDSPEEDVEQFAAGNE